MRLYSLIVGITCMLFFAACDSDVDDPYIPNNPDIVSSLAQLYPNAQDVTWEKKGKYEVASCKVNSNELEVWFNLQADWVMTEQDIFREQLPAPVENSFSGGEYANWVIDDLTELSFPNRPLLYLIEVEKGDKELALFYQADGTLVATHTITNANNTYWLDLLDL